MYLHVFNSLTLLCKNKIKFHSGEDKLLLRNMEVMIQIREEGFIVFIGGTLSDFFVHRRLISGYVNKPLRLLMPALDGNGRRHNVQLKKVRKSLLM